MKMWRIIFKVSSAISEDIQRLNIVEIILYTQCKMMLNTTEKKILFCSTNDLLLCVWNVISEMMN